MEDDENPAETHRNDLVNGNAKDSNDDRITQTISREVEKELWNGDSAVDVAGESLPASEQEVTGMKGQTEDILASEEQGPGVVANEKDTEVNDGNSPPASPFHDANSDDDLPTPGDFLAQDYYDVDPAEAAARSSNIESLINSIQDEPDDEPVTYNCDMCESVYATAPALEAHKKVMLSFHFMGLCLCSGDYFNDIVKTKPSLKFCILKCGSDFMKLLI